VTAFPRRPSLAVNDCRGHIRLFEDALDALLDRIQALTEVA
jgi:hypothetical protein